MNAHPRVSRTGGCVLTCMCAGSTCACGHLFMWWCVPWCMPPDHAAVGVCACACTCVACVCTWVQVCVCMCMTCMCALSGWGQTLDSQTGTPCPSCRDQRAGPRLLFSLPWRPACKPQSLPSPQFPPLHTGASSSPRAQQRGADTKVL